MGPFLFKNGEVGTGLRLPIPCSNKGKTFKWVTGPTWDTGPSGDPYAVL